MEGEGEGKKWKAEMSKGAGQTQEGGRKKQGGRAVRVHRSFTFSHASRLHLDQVRPHVPGVEGLGSAHRRGGGLGLHKGGGEEIFIG